MDADLQTRLLALIERGDRLLGALEQRYPQPPEVDWAAPAFRWEPPGRLISIPRPQTLALARLRGIDRQRQTLVRNTRQFLRGLGANNTLLWGARGTGKSSLVRALLDEFAGQGLRLIEIDARDLIALPAVAARVAGRPEFFILFADDLSFAGDDAGYRALKAALDGSLRAAPPNLLIYATSNRRHLLPEFLDENQEARNVDGEIHHGDAVEEKLSLSERFGLWLSFYPFDQQSYLDIVKSHLAALGSPCDDPQIEPAALQWALVRGVRSGRAAEQFARDWSGRRGL